MVLVTLVSVSEAGVILGTILLWEILDIGYILSFASLLTVNQLKHVHTQLQMPDGNNGDRSSFAYMFVRSGGGATISKSNLHWINAVRLDATGQNILHDVGRAQFDEHFNECPVMRYRRNDKVEAIYVRKTRMPSDFSAYGLFTMTWKSTPSNVLNEDFEIYSTEFDMLTGT